MTYAWVPCGLNATTSGPGPTEMVLLTLPVDTVITDTVLSPVLVTYAWVPCGLNATAPGCFPTVMVLVTLPVDTVITHTVS